MSVSDAVLDLPVVELARKLAQKEFTSLSLTEGYLNRIERRKELNAYITVTAELAIAQAKQADAARMAGGGGALLGIPFAMKDLIDTASVRTTWGTRALVDRVPKQDADVYVKLRAAGAVLLGKLTLTELANGFGNNFPEANHNGAVKSPWNLQAWAGGSSSGSGAAVAAGLCGFALGTETWGSIDSPAACCAATGLRPTYDVVSRRGVMPLGYTLDKVGVLARDARDTRVVLDAMAQAPLETPSRVPLRIAVVKFQGKAFSPEYHEAWTAAVDALRTIASNVEQIELPFDLARIAAAQVLIVAERDVALAGFIRGGGIEQMYDPEPWAVKQRSMAQLGLTGVDYVKAQRVRAVVMREWQALFERFDVVACGGRAEPPLSIAKRLPDDDYALSHARVLTDGNLAGLPAITLPIGFTKDHWPLTMHAVASAYEDHLLLAFAEAYQQRTEFHRRRPS